MVANLFPTIVAPLKKGNLQGPPMDWVCNVRDTCFTVVNVRDTCFTVVLKEYMFYSCFKGMHVLPDIYAFTHALK